MSFSIPALAGALRSLLGKNVGLPVLVSNHRVECPMPAQGWHHDADHVFGPETNFVEVFYFPQDTPLELGPTELLPGSHIRSTSRDIAEKGVSSAGPAGSFVIHSQSILQSTRRVHSGRAAPHAEIQLLADGPTDTGLESRTRIRLSGCRIWRTRRSEIRGTHVLLALR